MYTYAIYIYIDIKCIKNEASYLQLEILWENNIII